MGEEGEMHNARERDGMQHKIYNESKAVILHSIVKNIPARFREWLAEILRHVGVGSGTF